MKLGKEELDSVIKNCSNKLELNEFNELCRIIWNLLNGATFGIKDTWSTDFLRDCENIWHENKNLKKVSVKNCSKIVSFRDYQIKKAKKDLEKLGVEDDFLDEDFELGDDF